MIFYIIQNPIVLISLIVVLIFKLFPPKSINSWYGYRTTRSMKNDINWEIAQKYSANLSILILGIVLIIQCILYVLYQSTTLTELTTVGLWLVGMIILIIAVETKLKRIDK